MKQVRLLAIAPSCIEGVNREVYRRLATQHQVEVHLAIPSHNKIGAEYKTSTPIADEPFHITLLEPVGPTHVRLQRLKGLASLIRDLQPSHIVTEVDAATRLMNDIVGITRGMSTRVWSLSFENLERNYLRESLEGLRHRRLGAAAGGIIAWWLWRSAWQDIDHVFTVSSDGTRIMSAVGYAGRVSQIPLGFNPQLFYPQSTAKIAATRNRLGLNSSTIAYFGRLTPEKGIALLIDALATLKDLSWQFLVDKFSTYRTPYVSQLQRQIEELGIADRVIYFDAAHSEMPDYMNAADIVVLPSVSTAKWKEQYGRVIPEAMACGKIVVGSDSGAIPELIGDGGFVFPESDVKKLAELLRRLLTSTNTELELVQEKAIARAHSELSVVSQADIWSRMLRHEGEKNSDDRASA